MTFLDKLLEYYHLSKFEYDDLIKPVNEANVPSYNLFNNINIVKDKILSLIKENKKVLVYGDYDADGILATSIIVLTFKKLKSNVEYYIPSRYLDGYGLTAKKVIEYKEKGIEAIITVDNGVKAGEAIAKAHELGIEIIITDHHEYEGNIDTPYFLHPNESKLDITTSGAMTAFYLSYALLNEINEYLLILGAISILSDVMPLKGSNRNIVKLAIRYLNKSTYGKINLLSSSRYYDENVIMMNIVPKINAVGRIETKDEVNLLVKYFISDNYGEQLRLLEYINNTNEKRKNLANEAIANIMVNEEESAVVIKENILVGLTGLIASRLLDKYQKVACVFASEGDLLRGSLRSKNGLNVMDFINENKDLFVEFGGHDFAAGFTINESNFEFFKNKLNEYASNHHFVPSSDDIIIKLEDINFKNYEIVRSLSPFGHEFKEPIFAVKNIPTSSVKRTGKNNDTLIIYISPNVKVVGFRFDFNSLLNKETFDINGTMHLDSFKGISNLNFYLKK